MKYELTEDDVRAIHEAREHLRQHNRPAAFDCVKALAAKFPLPAPPKPVRYRLKSGTHFTKCGNGYVVEGTDVFVSSNYGEMFLEPIPNEPAKVAGDMPPRVSPGDVSCMREMVDELKEMSDELAAIRGAHKVAGVFKRGDWVRHHRDLVVGLVTSLRPRGFVRVSWDLADEDVPAEYLSHCEAPR